MPEGCLGRLLDGFCVASVRGIDCEAAGLCLAVLGSLLVAHAARAAVLLFEGYADEQIPNLFHPLVAAYARSHLCGPLQPTPSPESDSQA